jgi:hypothetical protein
VPRPAAVMASRTSKALPTSSETTQPGGEMGGAPTRVARGGAGTRDDRADEDESDDVLDESVSEESESV